MSHKQLYVVSRFGVCLFDYDLSRADDITLGADQPVPIDVDLVTGFLSAINSFASEMGWPAGISSISSGNLVCRISVGERVFTALIVDNGLNVGHLAEPVLEGLAQAITRRFEETFAEILKEAAETEMYRGTDFLPFREVVDQIFEEFKVETFELYQKLILIESMYAKVPRKWCIPLMERAAAGKNILGRLRYVISRYPAMKNAIYKINNEHLQVWDLFGIPLYEL